MILRYFLRVIVAATLSIVCLTTHAHHSEAAFDMEAVIAFQGTVTEYAWRNPHVYFKVQTIDTAGRPVEWEVETGATPILARSGWSRESLRVGEQITVRGHPARDRNRHYTILVSLDKADGTTLQQSVTNTAATASATSLAGIWKGNLANLEDVAQRFRTIPLTAEGAAARDAFDVNVENPVCPSAARAPRTSATSWSRTEP